MLRLFTLTGRLNKDLIYDYRDNVVKSFCTWVIFGRITQSSNPYKYNKYFN